MDRAKVLKTVLSEYQNYVDNDPQVRMLYAMVNKDKCNQTMALKMADLTGVALADSLVTTITPELAAGEALLLDDALSVIPAALKTNHDFVTSYLYQLQSKLDAEAGIGMKPVSAAFDTERARGLAEAATDGAFETLADIFKSQVENYSMHSVDESMRMTAESRDEAGLTVLVTRTYDDVGLSGGRECEWCKERECNDMPYKEAYALGAFERHDGCGCLITYTNAKGQTTYQARKGVWYKSSDEALRQRRTYGL